MSTAPAASSMLTMALRYAARGWHVFPLAPRSKVPAIAGGRGVLDAVQLPDAVTAAWEPRPSAGVGIATGPISGFFVVDVDPRNGGDETLGALEKQHGALPPTVRAVTGGGGQHILFAWPEGLTKIAGRLGDGIDLKGKGGYIVAPPSIHPDTGRAYAWDVGYLPSETPIAPAPAWLIAALSSPASHPARPALAGVAALDSLVGEAFRLSGMLGVALRDGMVAVKCPWLHEHSDGRGDGSDSSTAIFPPTTSRKVGGFVCLHGHCAGRSTQQALNALDPAHVTAARIKYGLHLRPVAADETPRSHFDPETGEDLDYVPEADPEADPRPEVRLSPHEVHENIDALDDALAAADPNIYQRAHQLVHVIDAKRMPGVVDDTPIVRAVTSSILLGHVTRRLRCLRYRAPSKEEKARAAQLGETAEGGWSPTVPAERTCLGPLLGAGEWRSIRPIRAVVESPVLRPDGTVLQTPGYDAASGYLYAPSQEFPPIPDEPTQADARRALLELADVFVDFPYVAPGHRSVPIAALLTILARAAIDAPVPAFVFEAASQGSGKSLQCQSIIAMATGRIGAVSALAEKEEEREKALSAVALSASPICFLDNVKGSIGGPKLEGLLTSTRTEFRVLGKADLVTLDWLAVVLATGNNQRLTKDMVRRCLLCRIESPLEDPTSRTTFAHELPTFARAERPRLLAAALTILRAYIAKGMPDAGQGSLGAPFGEWSRLVPGAILFAGGANPLDARATDDSVGEDDVSAMGVLLAHWDRIAGTAASMTAAELVRALRPTETPDMLDEAREALETLCPPMSPAAESTPASSATRSDVSEAASFLAGDSSRPTESPTAASSAGDTSSRRHPRGPRNDPHHLSVRNHVKGGSVVRMVTMLSPNAFNELRFHSRARDLG